MPAPAADLQTWRMPPSVVLSPQQRGRSISLSLPLRSGERRDPSHAPEGVLRATRERRRGLDGEVIRESIEGRRS
jgi:hypothetical protein